MLTRLVGDFNMNVDTCIRRSELRPGGRTAIADASHAATAEGVSRIVASSMEFGRLDALAHNAGFNLGELDRIFDGRSRRMDAREAVWPGMGGSSGSAHVGLEGFVARVLE
jgi:endonuclease/exonuclease/phosphatase family metal-dependent hydrolase